MIVWRDLPDIEQTLILAAAMDRLAASAPSRSVFGRGLTFVDALAELAAAEGTRLDEVWADVCAIAGVGPCTIPNFDLADGDDEIGNVEVRVQ